MCSTPFGIIDFDTGTEVDVNNDTVECSTPFGIIDFDTPVIQAARENRRSGAQRLSASLISTPFNVPMGKVPRIKVLNAFRHH